MALSPNYGWSEPDNSSLVKNGAADIRTLGDAIDTSVWNVGYGQAGKNKIINGDFGIWQRGTSFSNSVSNLFTADRWDTLTDKGTSSVLTTRQAFTAGAAPVAGYESQYFMRTVFSSGGSFCIQEQRVEDVRTFAGQTVTLSFWAKANAAVDTTPSMVQNFGSGGSAEVQLIMSTFSLTTSWVRYSATVTLGSISGKTIGSNNFLAVRPLRAVTASGFTIDIWGVQLEAGSVATPFQTASGGSPQAELAMCQRYYKRWSASTVGLRVAGFGGALNTTSAYITLDTNFRTVPNSLDYSNIQVYDGVTATAITSATVNADSTALGTVVACGVASGLTSTRGYQIVGSANTGYIGIGAEF